MSILTVLVQCLIHYYDFQCILLLIDILIFLTDGRIKQTFKVSLGIFNGHFSPFSDISLYCINNETNGYLQR